MNTNKFIGILCSDIPRKIIQKCPHTLCIPASVVFILQCHDPNITITQEELYCDQMNFESPTLSNIPGFITECIGFPLEENPNDISVQFSNWKRHILSHLDNKNPVAVCFRNPNSFHCTVIFQYSNESFKVFNPGSCEIKDSIVLNEIVSKNTCFSDHSIVEEKYYSTIETYTVEAALADLKANILQMQVLSFNKIC